MVVHIQTVKFYSKRSEVNIIVHSLYTNLYSDVVRIDESFREKLCRGSASICLLFLISEAVKISDF